MENNIIIQEVRRGRGRPKNKPDQLEGYLKSLVKNIKETPTVKSLTWFDAMNPPQTDEDFIEMIKNHTEYTKRMMAVYGFNDYEWTIIEVKWDYDQKLTNMYLEFSLFIFDEEQRNKALKLNISIN